MPGTRVIPRGEVQRLPLLIRRTGPHEVVVQASNDAVPDSYGTVIEVEGLIEWAEAYMQHRTVNLEHDLPKLGGRPMVGVATFLDFNPQLVVRVKLLDEEVARAVEERRIRGASIEFVPDPAFVERRRDGIHYRRLIPVPEATGLALTARPAVPGAEVLEVRSMLEPNWAFAVIDPVVLEGRVDDPGMASQLRWFPHHDLRTRLPVKEKVLAALDQAARGDFTVPDGASLTKEQIAARAIMHLERHLMEFRGELEAAPLELELRYVPKHVGSYGKSTGPWTAPTLTDFGHNSWDDLPLEEKRRIAAHFAWASSLDRFSDLKFPHHEPSKSGLGPVNKRACITGIAILNGARGGTDLPGEAKRQVYAHLARHLRDDFGMEPAALASRRVKVRVRLSEAAAKRLKVKGVRVK